MADIDIERKERGGMGWLWVLLALILLLVVGWWFWPDDGAEVMAPAEDTEMVQPVPEPATEPGSVTDVGLAQILANPSQWIGRTFPDTRAQVVGEMTDRGFFIQSEGEELLVVIIDRPQEEPADINPRQMVSITDGTLRGPDYLGQMEGAPLDEDTERLARSQEIFLVVDEANITILEVGEPQPGTDPAHGVQRDTMR